MGKSKTTNQKTMRQIMNERAVLAHPADPKVPWMPVPELRGAIMAMQKMERKYSWLRSQAAKRIDRYLAKFKNMDPQVKERKKGVMLEKAMAIKGNRLIKKGEKTQAKIDKIKKQPLNIVRMAA